MQTDSFPVPQIMEEIVEAILLVPQKRAFKFAPCSRLVGPRATHHEGDRERCSFLRATEHAANHGGDPAPQINEEIVKVVHVDVDTFNRGWEFRWSRHSLLFSVSSVCAKAPRMMPSHTPVLPRRVRT